MSMLSQKDVLKDMPKGFHWWQSVFLLDNVLRLFYEFSFLIDDDGTVRNTEKW